jgi:ubiquitin-conjugating enzyme E2 S
LTTIFHPNIRQPSGEICVNTLKKDWQSTHGLRHVLMVIRCLLIEPFPESALNEEAARLMLEDYEEYFRRAKMFTGIHAKVLGARVQYPQGDSDPASDPE